jgi:hypothetical protein|tara:strand:+ start:860 stop:997 length:138 start_codon:yes stop_codon:yes gene_type:complete
MSISDFIKQMAEDIALEEYKKEFEMLSRHEQDECTRIAEKLVLGI